MLLKQSALLVLLLVTQPLLHSAQAELRVLREFCKEDRQRYCAGEHNPSALFRCLLENEARLDGECRVFGLKHFRQVAEFREDCREDIEKFCTAMSPSGGTLRCLSGVKGQLTQRCSRAIERLRPRLPPKPSQNCGECLLGETCACSGGEFCSDPCPSGFCCEEEVQK